MTPEQRRTGILSALRAEGQVSVDGLAAALGASRETIRRDLAELDGRGLLRKVHGGAVAAELTLGIEGPLHERMGVNVAAKRAVARAAAQLLRPGDRLFVDTGSTTLIFGEELAAVSGLTVITNSSAIAALAAKGEGATVFLLGGAFRRGGGECVGEMVLGQIALFRATHAFLTVAAVDARGCSDHDLAEAQIARAMAAQADAVTVLADASKLGRSAPFSVAPLAAVHRLVSEHVPEPLLHALGRAGVEWVAAARRDPV